MKRTIFLIFLFFIEHFLVARKDSTRFTNFRGLYINTYYSYYGGGSYNDYYQKFPVDYEQFYYDGLKYYSQTPAIGIGGGMNFKGLFIKADVNYWHGTKAINYRSSHRYSLDGTQMDHSPWGPALPTGTKYNMYDDHLYGKLNLNHFDFCVALAGNISRSFRIYLGLRMNYIISHNLKAKLDREIKTYKVLYATSEYFSHDTLLETNHEYYSNKSIENVHTVAINKLGFLNFGLCYNFRIRKQLFITDLVLETSKLNFMDTYGFNYGAVTFKLSYVFNYSTRFGRKTYFK